MTARLEAPSRVVLVDKPEGWTSFDVVRKARRGLSAKVGHSGTLDPFATGLLLILVGQGTRLSSLLMDLPKEYALTAQFGAVSETGDPTGSVEVTGGRTTAGEIVSALDSFRGTITQRVPMTSAVKVAGEPLYKKAHRGEKLDTPEREVTVYDLTLLDFDEEAQQASLLVSTGKGTYVRTLIQDLGAVVGAGAYTLALERTRIGLFSVEDAVPAGELEPGLVGSVSRSSLPLSRALGFMPAHQVGGQEARQVSNGQMLTGTPSGRFRVHGPDGLLAIYEGPKGVAQPLMVFPHPED